MVRHVTVIALALVAGFLAPVQAVGGAAMTQDFARRASPFDGLRWVESGPEVRVGGSWYRPRAIDGLPVSDILALCESRWPAASRKRFGEDLVEAMVLLGQPPGERVTLELEPLAGGGVVTLQGVEMTEAKRNAIRDAGREPQDSAPAHVSRRAAEQDLVELEERLEDQFAYLELRGIDLDAELERVRAGLGDVVSVADLTSSVREVVMRFGDGHARVRSQHEPVPERWTPFLLQEAGGGVVAYLEDRSSFVHPERPFVHAIDGRPLDDWIDALRPTLAACSEQGVRWRATGDLRDLDRARELLGVPRTPRVRLSLGRQAVGGDAYELSLPLVPEFPSYGAWPRGSSRRIEGDEARGIPGGVGYLRLAEMDDELIPELRLWMGRFRGTGGLVVDVRSNGGGRRGLLLALAGYLLGEDDPPLVGNVAAYRSSARFERDHLGGSRHLYREDDAHWSERQRDAIRAFAPTFEPEWELPEGFSEWHYLLLDRTGHPDEYHYDAPVVVLCDAGCFSATDIFLGALERLPQVTLVGRASTGGSARIQSFVLPRTGIEVRCASMASFRPDGRLYDGRGIEVDVEVDAAPHDLLLGGGDAQLEAALDLLAS